MSVADRPIVDRPPVLETLVLGSYYKQKVRLVAQCAIARAML